MHVRLGKCRSCSKPIIVSAGDVTWFQAQKLDPPALCLNCESHEAGFAALDRGCRTCGQVFQIAGQEIAWLEQRGMVPPTHCRPCRLAKRHLRNERARVTAPDLEVTS